MRLKKLLLVVLSLFLNLVGFPCLAAYDSSPGGSGNFVYSDNAEPSGGPPISFAVFFKTNSHTSGSTTIAHSDPSGYSYYVLVPHSDAKHYFVSRHTTDTTFVGTSTFSDDTWYVGIGTEASSTSRAVYLDGAGKGTSSANSGTSYTYSRFCIGRYDYYADSNESLDGDLGEGAVWDASLSDDEAAILGKKFSPLLVRPNALTHYAPLVRTLQDYIGGTSLTQSGGTLGTEHPRVIMAY